MMLIKFWHKWPEIVPTNLSSLSKKSRFRSLGNLIYTNLPNFTQQQMITNNVGNVPAMD